MVAKQSIVTLKVQLFFSHELCLALFIEKPIFDLEFAEEAHKFLAFSKKTKIMEASRSIEGRRRNERSF